MSAEQRRAQLVGVAAELFSAGGVEGTAVSDIVAAAGVSQGTFYWHFDSKA
ncbi:MAG: TetR family transcriptional regulator, partial [Actinobacteria bacterium]